MLCSTPFSLRNVKLILCWQEYFEERHWANLWMAAYSHTRVNYTDLQSQSQSCITTGSQPVCLGVKNQWGSSLDFSLCQDSFNSVIALRADRWFYRCFSSDGKAKNCIIFIIYPVKLTMFLPPFTWFLWYPYLQRFVSQCLSNQFQTPTSASVHIWDLSGASTLIT
jgi:hypothetical protein